MFKFKLIFHLSLFYSVTSNRVHYYIYLFIYNYLTNLAIVLHCKIF